MAYGDFKDLPKRKLIKYYVIKNLLTAIYKLFDKKTAGGALKKKIMQNKKLPEELLKRIIRKFEI